MPGETQEGEVPPEEGIHDVDLKTFLDLLGIDGGDLIRARMELQRYQPQTGVSVLSYQGRTPFIRQECQEDAIRFLVANYERFGMNIDVSAAEGLLEKIATEGEEVGPIPSGSGTYEVSPGGQLDGVPGQRRPTAAARAFLTHPKDGGPSPSPLGSSIETTQGDPAQMPGLGLGPETRGSGSSPDALTPRGTGANGAASTELSDLASEHGEEFAQKVEGLADSYTVERLIRKACVYNNAEGFSDAQACLEAALLRDSGESQSRIEFYLQTGRCFEGLGRLKEARDAYSAALEMGPNELARSRCDALTGKKPDEPSGKEPGKETTYETAFREKFAYLGIDLKTPDAIAAKSLYVQVRAVIEEGETDELDNNQAVELLQLIPTPFDVGVSSEKDLIGSVQYAKWLAFQARQQTDDAEMQKLYLQAVGILDNVLKEEPKFKEASLLSEEYRTEMS